VTDTDRLLDSLCVHCVWVGTTDGDLCPQCGHGLLDYEVTVGE